MDEPVSETGTDGVAPGDLDKALLKRSAAPFSSRHRIHTVRGDVRSVVVVGEIVADDNGEVVATRGFYIDVTKSVEQDIQQQIDGRLHAIVADRAVIEQAKGMLIETYGVDADAAFDILRWRSQELNIKLHDIAKDWVAKVPALLNVQTDQRAPIDHLLMTLDASPGYE